jgi:hypothetical protein
MDVLHQPMKLKSNGADERSQGNKRTQLQFYCYQEVVRDEIPNFHLPKEQRSRRYICELLVSFLCDYTDSSKPAKPLGLLPFAIEEPGEIEGPPEEKVNGQCLWDSKICL